MRTESRPVIERQHILRAIYAVAAFCGLAVGVDAQPPAAMSVLSREEAVHQALVNNPTLRTVRKQQGYGEAALLVAKTYPFNPVYTGYVTQNGGPTSAGITNRVYQEHYVALELELRGQGSHRKAAAAATVSRIDWEISQQEITVSVAAIRAFNAVLYRQQKLAFLDEGIKVTELAIEQTRQQFDAGKLKKIDWVLARADLDGARAQRGQARTTLAVSRSDLRRVLGTLDEAIMAVGNLDAPLPSTDPAALTRLALERRPDLHARRAAIGEAEAGLRLVNANRYGNPSVGPYFEYDPTRITYIGARLSMPLAIFNTKKAEIRKAETDVAKLHAEVQGLELQASQDVQAALARLADAHGWAGAYRTDVLPNLLAAKNEMEGLFAKKDASVDLARLIALKRGYLKASESLLDASYEESQAKADLALAVAEPALALGAPAALTAETPRK